MAVSSDATFDAAVVALRALAARQRATAGNVANLETPGYKARRVEFEDSLRRAIEHGDPRLTRISERVSDAPALPNGNNVSIDQELVGSTGLRYQLMLEVVDYKLRTLRTSVGSGR